MLITKLKDKTELWNMLPEKVRILRCHGCRELSFPEAEAKELQEELDAAGRLIGCYTMDYICRPEHLKLNLEHSRCETQMDAADAILVLSCGVGVQTVAAAMPQKRVFAACDTIRLPGFQGVTPTEYDCAQCGECHLNATGGICPVTACSKSLVNGPCGGTKHGRCEVDPDMDCGWERIFRRLEKQGRLSELRHAPCVRDFSKVHKVGTSGPEAE